MWERSINLCDELAVFYRSGIFDYRKLSASLRQSADLFDAILASGHRETHAYFRVVFCGPAFSATMRDKAFVFRGRSFDTLASFSERINTEWPDVSVVIRHKEIATDLTCVDNAEKSGQSRYEFAQHEIQFLLLTVTFPILKLNFCF